MSGINPGILDNKAAAVILLILPLLLLVYVIYISSLLGYPELIAALAVSLAVLFFIIRKPALWATTLPIVFSLFALDSQEGITVTDVIFAVYLNGSLYLWFVWQILVKKEKIVEHFSDWLILAFFVFVLAGNLVIGILNGIDFLNWLSEYALFTLVLYYFPLKKYLFDEDLLKKFLVFMFAGFTIVALYQLYMYLTFLSSGLQYAYELQAGVSHNQTYMTAASTLGVLLVLFSKSKSKKIFFALTTLLSMGTLLISFSRTFWIVLLINLAIIFLYIPFRIKLKMSAVAFAALSFFAIAAWSVLENNVTILIKVIEKRLQSSTQGKQDISIRARLYEWEQAIIKIKENPLGGNGLSKKFYFYNPISEHTSYTTNIHNGYLSLSYRLGIPLAITYVLIILMGFNRAAYAFFNLKGYGVSRIIALSSALFFILLFLSNFMAQIFIYRDGFIVTALALAFAAISEKKLMSEKLLSKKS